MFSTRLNNSGFWKHLRVYLSKFICSFTTTTQDNSVLILDARSYKDYSAGHIPGSVSLDLFSFHWADTSEKGLISFGEHMRKILSYAGVDENKKIIFYDSGHWPLPRNQMIKETLSFIDQYTE
mgnify:CR=1 FL=1